MQDTERWETVAELPTPFAAGGVSYKVSVEGSGPRSDGTWAGRLVFRAGTRRRITRQETSQPNREALQYWATGLEKIYLEGAHSRSSDD